MSDLPQLHKQSLQTIRIHLLKKAVLVQVKIKSLEEGLSLPEKSKAVQKLQRRVKIALFDYAANSASQEPENKSFTVKLGKIKAICRLRFQRFLKYPLTTFQTEDQKVKSSYEVCPQILFLDVILCSQSYVRATKPSPKYLAELLGKEPAQTDAKPVLSKGQLQTFLQIRKQYENKFDKNYFQSESEGEKKPSEEGGVSQRLVTLEKLVFNHGVRGDVELMQNLSEGKFYKKCNFNFAEYNEPLFKTNIFEAFRVIGSLNLSETNKEKLKKLFKMLVRSAKWKGAGEKGGISLYRVIRNREMRNLMLPLAKCL